MVMYGECMLGMLAVTLEVGLADHPLAPSLHGHHHRRCPTGALEMSHAASIGSANPSTQRHSESISSLTRSCIALFALRSLQCNCTIRRIIQQCYRRRASTSACCNLRCHATREHATPGRADVKRAERAHEATSAPKARVSALRSSALPL